jgi:ABC-type oligopeptide transport system substrate-binding subunit
MQAAPLSRPEEVTMLIRRLTACACALALAVPAVASAQPANDPPTKTSDHVVYGDTKYDLQNTQELGPKGDTKSDVKPAYVDRVGSLSAAQLAAAYGTTPKPTPVASSSAQSSDDGGTNGWQIAAIAEAGLLAAIALGSAALVGRRRPRHGAAA